MGNIPEQFRGEQKFIVFEIEDAEGKGVLCVSGPPESPPGSLVSVLLSVKFGVQVQELLTINGLSEEAAILLEKALPEIQKNVGITEHNLMQLLVSRNQ